MSRQKIRCRNALQLVLVGALALSTGCGPGTTTVATTAVPAGTAPAVPAATPGTVPAAPGTTAGGIALPGALSTAGAAGAPPIAALPPAKDVKSEIQRLKTRFNLKGIDGSGATAENLALLEQAYSRYPAFALADLYVTFEPPPDPTFKAGEADGIWQGALADGKPEPKLIDVATPIIAGHIYYFPKQMYTGVIYHEVGHHLTIKVAPEWGKQLCDNLGYVVKDAQGITRLDRLLDCTTFDNTKVPASTYDTDYSKTNNSEHLAELIELYMDGRTNQEANAGPILTTFRWPPVVLGLLQQKLGAPQADI